MKLAANESVGELILSKLRDSDTLSGVNLACQEVNRVYPFGYEEFLDITNLNLLYRYKSVVNHNNF